MAGNVETGDDDSGSREQKSGRFTGGQPVEPQFQFRESQVRLTTTTTTKRTTTTTATSETQNQRSTSEVKRNFEHELEERNRKGKREQSSNKTEIGSEGAVKLVANKLATNRSVQSRRASPRHNNGHLRETNRENGNDSSLAAATSAGSGGGGGTGQELQGPSEGDAGLKGPKEKTTAKASPVQKKIGLLEALLGDRGKSWFENKTVILDIQNGKQKKPVEVQSRQVEQADLQDKLATRGQSEGRENQKAAGQTASVAIDNNNKPKQQQVSTASGGSVIKYSRLPTFGSIPQRLSNLSCQSRALQLSRPPSLPYFSYQGHARNIDISRRPKTPTGKSRASSGQVSPTQVTSGHERFRYSRTSDADGSLASDRLSNSSASSSRWDNSPLTASSTPPQPPSNSSDSSTNSHQGSASQLANKLANTSAGSQRAQTLASARGDTRQSTVRRLSLSSPPSSRQSEGTKGVPPTQSKLPSSRKASSLGYSNISNLFPGAPAASTRLWRPGSRQNESIAAINNQRYKLASLLNLSDSHSQQQQQQRHQQRQQSRPGSGSGKLLPASPSARDSRRAQSVAPLPVQPIRSQQQQNSAATASTKRRSNSGTMRRQVAGSSQQNLGPAASANNYANSKRDGARLRPMSATGNYLASGANRQRSPMLSASAYRLGSAGMSPLIDPDCPVHGDNLGPPPASARGRYSANSRADHYEHDDNTRSSYAGAARGSRGYHSASQPDLAFNDDRGPADQYHDDPYNTARPTYGGSGSERPAAAYKSSSVYSPQGADHAYDGQPPEYRTSQHGQWAYDERQQQQQHRRYKTSGGGGGGGTGTASPYYNSVSRFSLYQPTGDGNIRSSLAPTSEQLRRILGYKPPSAPKPVHLHPQWAYTRPFIHLQPAGSGFGRSLSPLADMDAGDYLDEDQPEVPKFAPFNRLQDNQAIRAVDFHPSGEVYAIGSNSRALRICAYPAEHELRHFDPLDTGGGGGGGGGGLIGEPDSANGANSKQQWQPKPPRVLFKFLQVHRGSIYCVSFNPSGQLLATGSNDQTIHIVKYNSISHNPDGEEFRLTMHNGTIRDLCFIDDSSGNGSSLLLSAGGGDNKIYVTDCDTITPFQSMAGHTQMVMALNHCGGAQFVSGSYDKTIRFWDLRRRSCTSIVSAPPLQASATSSGPGAPVCALRVDPSGRLLASGHTDTTCMLYDIRGGKIIQTFRPHDDEIRAISFSPKSYYLLTGGYDGRLVVSDLQGDLTQPLPSVCVAESQDKIVQAKWHPADFTFVSTSADKSATLWSLPGEIHN